MKGDIVTIWEDYLFEKFQGSTLSPPLAASFFRIDNAYISYRDSFRVDIEYSIDNFEEKSSSDIPRWGAQVYARLLPPPLQKIYFTKILWVLGDKFPHWNSYDYKVGDSANGIPGDTFPVIYFPLSLIQVVEQRIFPCDELFI
jgi:hypothetical protein